MTASSRTLQRIRLLLGFFMLALLVSGLTAIPLQWEIWLLDHWLGPMLGSVAPSVAAWISRVNQGIQNGYGSYPFLAYGTDWLAFGHVTIAVAFIGPMRDPIRNKWVIEFGMIACALVIPWALIFGPVRGIPPLWTLVDMSFGVVGVLPLWLARREIGRMEARVQGDCTWFVTGAIPNSCVGLAPTWAWWVSCRCLQNVFRVPRPRPFCHFQNRSSDSAPGGSEARVP